MSLRNIRRSRKKKPKIEAPTNADLKRPANLNSRCGPLQNAVVSILKTNPPIEKPRESEKKHSKDDRHSSKRKTETERVEVKRESRRRIEYENNHRKSPEARKRRVDEREEKVVVKERKRDHRLKHERQVNSPSEVGDSPPRFQAVKKNDRKVNRTPEIIKLSPDPPQKTVEEKEDKNSTTFIIRVGNKEIRRTVANDPPDPHGANDKNNANFVEKKRKRRADDPGRTAARLLSNQLKATVVERPRITAPAASSEPVVKKPKVVEQSVVKQQITSGVEAEIKTESPLKPLAANWNGRITIEDESSDEVIAALDREQLTSQILPTAMLTRPTYYPVGVQQQVLSQSSSVSYVALPTVQQPQRSNERCRFWPNCDRGEACVFHHPTKPCATFPNCVFGDKCLYIHPICKFNTRCTRANCPFTHDLKGTATYQGKCTDPNCAFFHPPDCRYGMSCTNPRCTFSHKRPDLKKFQWTATSTSS
ncbi:Zinc finger CCCH domain-containing protein 14 [Aphelenchoides besseyi]|nr:Zinc finger CCCH domain-containing protein 14 [Aphelenchoides besseyi]